MSRNKDRIDLSEIRLLVHSNAESGFMHSTYDSESLRFHLLMNGDMRAVDESMRVLDPKLQGKLSDDPLRNMRYLFIVNTGLATRYMIEAGVPQENVYAISDVYIQRADKASSIAELRKLNREVWKVFVQTIRERKSGANYSSPVHKCLNYIDSNFNMKITLEELGEVAGLNPVYLAELFRKETGVTVGAYIRNLRVSTAEALLARTEYPYSMIALSLGFCSQSHFAAAFKRHVGMTPGEYRREYYNRNITAV